MSNRRNAAAFMYNTNGDSAFNASHPPRSRSNASLNSVRVDEGPSAAPRDMEASSAFGKGGYGGSKGLRTLVTDARIAVRKARETVPTSFFCIGTILFLWTFLAVFHIGPFSCGPVAAPGGAAPVTLHGSASTTKYALVIDAGSTGSRIHIFSFVLKAGLLELDKDNFHQLKPGLSAFAGRPDEAARSLKPLLDQALSVVPAALQAETPVEVRATAGLRLLPGDQATEILDGVRRYLRTFPFKLQDDQVSILDGIDEGAFAWLTLNYLLGKMSEPWDRMVAAVDQGGGSVQMAYAMDPKDAARAPEGYVRTLGFGDKTFKVYVHSYLGYGLMAARAAVLSSPAGGAQCAFAGQMDAYPYAGKTHAIGARSEGPEFSACSRVMDSVLDSSQPCGAPKTECAFGGAWAGSGPRESQHLYISSYFFDRAIDSGIVGDASAYSFDTTAAAFKTTAERVCNGLGIKTASEVHDRFKTVEENNAPFFCMDLTFQYNLLTRGFKLTEGRPVTLVRKVPYHGEYVEAAWPLGAALATMSRAR